MNVTLQSYVPASRANLVPMHVISNDSIFINNRGGLDLLAKKISLAINEGEKRFEMKTSSSGNSKNWVEKLKVNKRDIFFTKPVVKKIDSTHDRYECVKNGEIKNRLPEKDIALDIGCLSYARKSEHDNNGITPLMAAIGNNGSLDEIRNLISKKASVDIQDKKNNTALIWLIKSLYRVNNEKQLQSKVVIMENLFHAGANMTLAGPAGFTPMMYAIAVNSVPAFKMSYRNAEDFRSINDAGETSLHLALKYDADPQILKVLISLYNFMNVKDKRGYTPFMMASFRARHDIMDTLLKKGGDINDFDARGWTALMHAVNCDDEVTVNYLVAKGAKILIKDCCNKDTLMMAQEQKKNHMVNLLLPKANSESAMLKSVQNDLRLFCENKCDLIDESESPQHNNSLDDHDHTRYEIIDIQHRALLLDAAASTASKSVPFTPFLIKRVIQGLYDGIREFIITRTPLTKLNQ